MSVRSIIILISGLFLFLQSCSVFKGTGRIEASDTLKFYSDRIELASEANNISGEDLIIGRTRIQYRSAEINKSVSGFIKHKKEGDLLLSLRSLAGIEVARAYLGNDSIKVLDKINGDLYIQSEDYLEFKLGLSYEAIALLWGDFPSVFVEKIQIDSLDNKTVYSCRHAGILYNFVFDYKLAKLKEVRTSQINGNTALIKYGEYIRSEKLLYPQTVTMDINKGNILIELNYGSIKREKIKNMKFSTASNPRIHILK